MQLRDFYRDVNRVLKTKTKPYWFSYHNGLCRNLKEWTISNCGGNIDWKEYNRLKLRMRMQFNDAGLSSIIPFNNDIHYITETNNGIVYDNPKRLMWIKDHI